MIEELILRSLPWSYIVYERIYNYVSASYNRTTDYLSVVGHASLCPTSPGASIKFEKASLVDIPLRGR